jgi:hypothetical protein
MKNFLPLLLLTACASAPTSDDPMRIVQNREDIGKHCRVLGKVKIAEDRVLRKRANAAGADTIYLFPSKNQAFFLRCHPRAPTQNSTEAATQEPRSLPNLDAPNFAPETPETLPKPELESLPEAAPN